MPQRSQSRSARSALVPLEIPAAVLHDLERALPADVRRAFEVYVPAAALQVVAHCAVLRGWQRTLARRRDMPRQSVRRLPWRRR
jgi:hypothetical protein